MGDICLAKPIGINDEGEDVYYTDIIVGNEEYTIYTDGGYTRLVNPSIGYPNICTTGCCNQGDEYSVNCPRPVGEFCCPAEPCNYDYVSKISGNITVYMADLSVQDKWKKVDRFDVNVETVISLDAYQAGYRTFPDTIYKKFNTGGSYGKYFGIISGFSSSCETLANKPAPTYVEDPKKSTIISPGFYGACFLVVGALSHTTKENVCTANTTKEENFLSYSHVRISHEVSRKWSSDVRAGGNPSQPDVNLIYPSIAVHYVDPLSSNSVYREFKNPWTGDTTDTQNYDFSETSN